MNCSIGIIKHPTFHGLAQGVSWRKTCPKSIADCSGDPKKTDPAPWETTAANCGPRKRFKWLGFFVDAKKFSPVTRGLVSGLGKIPGFSWVFLLHRWWVQWCFALHCCAVSPWLCHCFTPNSVLWSQKGYNPGQVEPTFLSAVALAVAVFLEKCHKMSLSK